MKGRGSLFLENQRMKPIFQKHKMDFGMKRLMGQFGKIQDWKSEY